MARRGVVIVDQFEWRGVIYPIKLHKESGDFSANIPNPDESQGTRYLESFRGDLPTVKSQLEKYLKEADGKDLKWEPVILIKVDQRERWEMGRHGQNSLDLTYDRGFRAKTISGKLLWREFNVGNDDDNVEVKIREYNSDAPYYRTTAVELAYTPERWSSLRLITKTMEIMNERLQAILQGGADEVAKMLTGISEKGAQMLLPAPKEGGKGR